MSYEPLHHKYRPQTFAELVGQDVIATTLSNAIHTQRIAPAYLFTGPRGTGKTSSARILAKSLNCLNSDKPTEKPCGICDVCRGIAKGSTLDVIEIDAASNTGVDNIREIIERAQFAPVQCRYKVYVIDECLTGDSLVQTNDGLVRIDNPHIIGKQVLSYNDFSSTWEFKKVVRWLDQGKRQILVIRTTNREIRCTANHLIRTESGWIAAKDLREGAKILSPVNVTVEPLSTELEPMDALGDLSEDTNLKVIHTDRSCTTWLPSLSRLNPFDLCALVGVVKSLMFQAVCSKRVMELREFSHAGKSIHTERDTASGNFVQKSSLPVPKFWNQTHLDLSTELCLETAPSVIQINIVDFLDWLGRMGRNSGNGWNTKPTAYRKYSQKLESHLTKDTETCQFAVAQRVILNSEKFLMLLNRMGRQSLSLWTGLIESLQKDLLGGIWMMALSHLAQKEARLFKFIRKDILLKKTKSLPIGLRQRDIHPEQSLIKGGLQAKFTTTQAWAQIPAGSGCQTSSSIPSPAWSTSLERVEFVKVAGVEKVYDLEIEDNHNFVANGLLVHNCHMLSTAAFNSLLKTLEEPPDRVVFVLATTDPQRVLPTIISRCQRFDYRRIPIEAMVTHLSAIAHQEKINIAPEAVRLVAQIAQGGLRDAESLLDQLSLLSGQVTVEQIWELVGSCSEPDLLDLLQAIAGYRPEAVLDSARKIMDRGREPLTVLQNFAGFYRDLLIAKITPNRSDLVTLTAPTWKALCELAPLWDMPTILAGQKHLKDSEIQIKQTTQPRLWLEMTLLGLLRAATSSQVVSHAQTGIQPSLKIDRQQQPTSNLLPTQPTTPTSYLDSQPSLSKENPPPVSNSPDSNASQTKPVNQVESSPSISAAPVETQEQIWQEVLAQIQPESTKQMLRQFSHLISLEDAVARVSLPQKWQEKLKVQDKIEVAFQKTLNYQVEVILQAVAPQAKTANSNQSQQQPPSLPTSQLAAVLPPAESVNKHLPPEPAQDEMQPKMGMTEVDHLPQVISQSESLAEISLPTSVEPNNDEVAIAAQRLAKAVNGEVIGFNLNSSEEKTTPSPLPDTISTWEDTDTANEAEFDF